MFGKFLSELIELSKLSITLNHAVNMANIYKSKHVHNENMYKMQTNSTQKHVQRAKQIRNKNMYKMQTVPKQEHMQNRNKSETKTCTKCQQMEIKTYAKHKQVQTKNCVSESFLVSQLTKLDHGIIRSGLITTPS